MGFNHHKHVNSDDFCLFLNQYHWLYLIIAVIAFADIADICAPNHLWFIRSSYDRPNHSVFDHGVPPKRIIKYYMVVPSGKLLHNYLENQGKPAFLMGKSTISTGPFSIAMFVYQRVNTN